MFKTSLFAIALSFTTVAFAQPSAEPPLPTETISTADLNVGSSSGQAVLRHRIQAAAGRVCDIGGMASLEDFRDTAQCYRRAYADAIRQMDQVVAARSTGTAIAASSIVVTAK